MNAYQIAIQAEVAALEAARAATGDERQQLIQCMRDMSAKSKEYHARLDADQRAAMSVWAAKYVMDTQRRRGCAS